MVIPDSGNAIRKAYNTSRIQGAQRRSLKVVKGCTIVKDCTRKNLIRNDHTEGTWHRLEVKRYYLSVQKLSEG